MSSYKPIGIFASDRAIGTGGTPYVDAFQSDINKYNTIDAPTALDAYIIDDCVLDNSLQWRISRFNEGRRIGRFDRIQRQEFRRLNNLAAQLGELAAINFEFIDQYGLKQACETTAESIDEQIPSKLYPGYSQSKFELWSRRSISRAYIPFYLRLFSSRESRLLDVIPTQEDSDEYSTNSFAAIFMLTHLLDISPVTQANQDKRFTYEGFINEIDLLGQIAMSRMTAFRTGKNEIVENEDGVFASSAWTLPSAFIDDVSGERIDGQELNQHLESGNVADSLIDIKRKKGGKKTTLAPASLTGRSVRRINAVSSGSFDELGQIMPGVKAMQVFLAESTALLSERGFAYYEQSSHLNILRLYARGFAQAGIDLTNPAKI